MVIWMVLLGIVTNLWGRFIHKKVEAFSFVLISEAILLAGLSEFQIWTDELVTIALLYFSVWTIGLGLVIKKYQRS